jgi:hypothetical protein
MLMHSPNYFFFHKMKWKTKQHSAYCFTQRGISNFDGFQFNLPANGDSKNHNSHSVVDSRRELVIKNMLEIGLKWYKAVAV